MSSDERRGSLFAELSDTVGDDHGRELAVSIEEETREEPLADLLDRVEAAMPVDDVSFDEELIKENLTELLLLLISVRGGSHGKRLIGDLAELSGEQLSPGTVYPVLHDLEEAGLLEMQKKVRTKEYFVDDDEAVTRRLEAAMIQHVAYGLLVYAFLFE